MLSVVERVWALTVREVRLLGRNRPRLVSALAVPLAGGIVCGWMTRTTSLPPVYCLLVFLILGAVVLSADPRTKASRAISAVAGRGMFMAAWILTALLILILQAAVLTTCASTIGGFEVTTGVLAGGLAASLAVGAILRQILSG